MWHVSSRSGVAALRTAIHLLLTYLLTCLDGRWQDAEAVAKDELQRVLQMTEVRRRQWEKTWEEQRARLEQNLQMCQFFFDLRQVGLRHKNCSVLLTVLDPTVGHTMDVQCTFSTYPCFLSF